MNNSITEDYCSFEVSKLLKEKGFRQSQPTGYWANGMLSFGPVFEFNRPTHALAIKWIRENFGIHIHIEYIDDILLFLYVITTIKTNTIEKDEAKYNSPEEAVEAALLHTLKELI